MIKFYVEVTYKDYSYEGYLYEAESKEQALTLFFDRLDGQQITEITKNKVSVINKKGFGY